MGYPISNPLLSLWDAICWHNASMVTPLTNSTSLLPVAAYLARCDKRTVARLCSDTGTAIADGALASDPNLAAALLDATGAVEAACLVSGRYSPTDLAALTGAAQAHLYRLLSRLTTLFLWERRPDLEMPMPPLIKEALDELELIRKGERLFGTVEAVDAGVVQSPKMTEAKVRDRAEVSYQSRRLFGNRAAWSDQDE